MHLLLKASRPSVGAVLVAVALPLMVLPGWGLFRLPLFGWLRMLSVSGDLPFHVWLPSHCCGLPLNWAFPRDPSGNNCFTSNEWLPLSGRTVIHVINSWISWQGHASSAECKWACEGGGVAGGFGFTSDGAARMEPFCFISVFGWMRVLLGIFLSIRDCLVMFRAPHTASHATSWNADEPTTEFNTSSSTCHLRPVSSFEASLFCSPTSASMWEVWLGLALLRKFNSLLLLKQYYI